VIQISNSEDDLDNLEKKLLMKEITDLKEIVEEQKEKIKELTNKLTMQISDKPVQGDNGQSGITQVEAQKEDLEDWSSKSVELNEILDTLRAKEKQLSQEIEIHIKEKQDLQTLNNDLKVELENLKKKSERLESETEKNKKASEDSQFEIEKVKIKNEQLKEELKTVKEEIEILRQENNEIKLKQENLEKINEELTVERDKLSTENKEIKIENKKLIGDVDIYLGTIKDLKLDLKNLKDRDSTAKGTFDLQIIDLKKEVKVLRRERDHYKQIIKEKDLLQS
jgi:chromosome segregation ATPase